MSPKTTTPIFVSLILFATPAPADDPPGEIPAGVGQLGAAIEWIDVPDSDGDRYMVQRSRDGRLILSPNESFFPKLGLTASGSGAVDDVAELNGGNSFAFIGKWDAGDQAEWGLWLERAGEVEINIWMSGLTSAAKFSLQLSDRSESFTAAKTQGTTAQRVASLSLRVDQPGRHSLVVNCDENSSASAALHWIEVSGPAARNGAVLRKRWRPAAAHTKFTSSSDPQHVRLWIMEMDALPGTLDFYSPLTTPFGYYGPTWRADGVVNTGFNFSLWSFGRGQPEPPVEQLSHLIAIGDPEASFGGFDHEGTGVKIRDWEPLAGRQGQRQTFALRVEPGEMYDTYFTYFFASDEKRWQLFGVGKKYNRGKPLDSLWVGSFVEVPGPPANQRTGAYARTMRYRGWAMDEQQKWYPLDRMANGNVDKETGLTHTDRGLTGEGWFYLETGGWIFRQADDGDFLESPASRERPQVDYLDDDDLAFLQTVPSEITGTGIEPGGDRARVSFNIRNLGENAEVTLYHGPSEGLTFADRWAGSAKVSPIKEGDNQFVIEQINPAADLKVRLLLKNNQGQFWSMDTLQ